MKNSSYRRLLARIDELEKIVDGDDEIVIDELDEQLPEELDAEDLDAPVADDDEIILDADDEEEIFDADDEETFDELAIEEDDIDADDDISLADDVLELPEDEDIINSDEDVEEVLDACDELEAELDELEADDCEVTASEEEPGIEDEINDTANGGDPTVSELPDTKIDVESDEEVYPTRSEYVARITSRLDRVASTLERMGNKRMAFRVDQLSDEIEKSIR